MGIQNMKKFLFVILSSCLLLIFSVYLFINKKNRENFISQDQQIVRVNLQEEPSSLNPQIGFDLPCHTLQKALFEGMVRVGQENELHLAAARSIVISEDKRHYVFYLKDLLWSNGKSVTAHDFEWAWKRAVTPGSDCTRADLFYFIKNGEKVKKGNLPLEQFGVYAVDDKTLNVELEHPYPEFLDALTSPVFSPLYKDEKGSVSLDITNGPFRIASWKHNEEIILIPNPLYWDRENVRLEKIMFSCVNDPNTALLLFEKNKLDWIGAPFTHMTTEACQKLSEMYPIKSKTLRGTYCFYLNSNHPLLASKKIRQALSCALNREEICKYVLHDETPHYSPLPIQISLCHPKGSCDIEKAKQLFKEGLNELDLQQIPPLTLSHSNLAGQKTLAEAVQQDWEKAFGIKVHLEGNEWNVFFKKMRSREYEVGGYVQYSLIKDPLYMLKFYTDSTYPCQCEHPSYYSLLELAEREVENEKRMQILHEAEQLLIDEMPAIALYSVSSRFAKNKNLKGMVVSDVGRPDFKWAYIEPLRFRTSTYQSPNKRDKE